MLDTYASIIELLFFQKESLFLGVLPFFLTAEFILCTLLIQFAEVKPTKNKLWLFSILYQILPIVSAFGIQAINPEAKTIGLLIVILIFEAVLAVILINWKKQEKVEVVDEREELIRLRVKANTLKYVEVATLLSIFAFFFNQNIPALYIILIIGLPAIIGEVYSNIVERRLSVN